MLINVMSNRSVKNWCGNRLTFLPGETWPERWLITCTKDGDLKKLAGFLQVSEFCFAKPIFDEMIGGKKIILVHYKKRGHAISHAERKRG